MNIGVIKIWAWATAALLTLGLSWYVLTFVKNLPELNRPPDPAVVKKVLEGGQIAPTKSDAVYAYSDVKHVMAEINWTGKVKAVEAPVATVPDKKEPTVVPVKKLIKITMVREDPVDPTGSRIFIKYRSEAGVPNNGPTGGFILHVGDHLASPHNGIKVDAIAASGVTFTFDDAKREKETLGPDEFDARAQIVQVSPDGVLLPKVRTSIPKGQQTAFIPKQTTQIGRNQFKLGTEDVAEFERRYQEILSSEVRMDQHRDPRTGKYDGIEIKSVQAGSIADRHGAQAGDIVKSINGHPVNSQAEAVQYVKNNANAYTHWEIEVENMGKTRTVTYESPNH